MTRKSEADWQNVCHHLGTTHAESIASSSTARQAMDQSQDDKSYNTNEVAPTDTVLVAVADSEMAGYMTADSQGGPDKEFIALRMPESLTGSQNSSNQSGETDESAGGATDSVECRAANFIDSDISTWNITVLKKRRSQEAEDKKKKRTSTMK